MDSRKAVESEVQDLGRLLRIKRTLRGELEAACSYLDLKRLGREPKPCSSVRVFALKDAFEASQNHWDVLGLHLEVLDGRTIAVGDDDLHPAWLLELQHEAERARLDICNDDRAPSVFRGHDEEVVWCPSFDED